MIKTKRLVSEDHKVLETTVRRSIVAVLTEHNSLLSIAVRQRAKFEGWLKFELAARLESIGMHDVRVETQYAYRKTRSDISLFYEGYPYDIELKTPNANWHIDGVEAKTRPITKNINSIVDDAIKMREKASGIIAFVLFPIPLNDDRWEGYLERIGSKLRIDLNRDKHCEELELRLDNNNKCRLAVCTFGVLQQ